MSPETIESIFTFSAMWAFGGPMIIDKSGDYRKKFSEDFGTTFGVKFPKEGLCFDYLYDPTTGEHVQWQSMVPKHASVPIGMKPGETPFNELFVETVETVRITYLLDKLAKNGKYAMLVAMPALIEGYIDKRSGNIFGPPMGKKMVFFIDDMNLPYVETYGTQNSIALITQHMQYGSIFDRTDLGMRKNLVDIQYIAAMNPTAVRSQYHLYEPIRWTPWQLQPVMQELTSKIVDTAIQVHEAVSSKFLPSAVRFMYNWNMRELTNIFQGLCHAKGDYYIKPSMLVKLFTHESYRVYADRLVTEEEVDVFSGFFTDIVKKNLPVEEEVSERGNVFTNFVTTTDGSYLPIPSMEKLKSVLMPNL
ncbi:hypothetical protein QTG54_001688 [Skeletonema marinoi]|uniref:Uncharacterized protein n=1 Tax=Skeletonema marinoi TaxID=267567 RepID=A0AAD8YM37_9STRA|nr:hypothetical protein QTG54_001688 [Skeletonema marinoi]